MLDSIIERHIYLEPVCHGCLSPESSRQSSAFQASLVQLEEHRFSSSKDAEV